jgi:RNA polymerase sigma-54 factor
MSLAPRLDLRQSQSLVMTPQLQQAIKLLALSSVEIEAYVAEEVERNPLLETGGGETAGDAPFDDAPVAPQIESNERGSDDVLGANDMAASEALDVDFGAETFDRNGSADGMLGLSGGGAANGATGEAADFDSFAAADITLREHLLNQAGSVLSDQQLFLAQQLIEQIEPTGYLNADLLATAHRLGMPMADLEAALAAVQTFDPTGVGARNLAECLALQAKEADRYDPCMAKLIDNLDLVARGSFDQLRRLCRVDDEDLRDMLVELRSYDPKPGCRFESEASVAVTPDIFVTVLGSKAGGGWAIELNSANLPRILINKSYYAELGTDKAAKAWLNDCMADANWLIKAMDQRQRTIMKVATEIVKQQDGFFRKGVAHLRPLTLRQVAEAIEMHESTVSRVTSNKYLSCDRGLFDLKFFFSSGVQSADGDGASSEAVKSHIKTLIDGEGAKILSDDTLVDLLTARGFDIARRTVAKYREAMGIGSSVQRRRQKKMGR